MAETPCRLHAQQHALTRYLRAPDTATVPAGLDPRRVAIYRRLLFDNLLGLLRNGFPVSTALLGEAAWAALVRRFYAGHHSQAPLFTELAAEFVQWLQAQPDLPHPALAELAHYEWVETALHQLDACPLPSLQADDAATLPLQRSPLAWPLLYRWPVHRLGAADAPATPPPQPTALLARRDAQGDVRFSLLGTLAVQLLDDIGRTPGQDGRYYLRQLERRNGLAGEALEASGIALLRQFGEQAVIGVATAPRPDAPTQRGSTPCQ